MGRGSWCGGRALPDATRSPGPAPAVAAPPTIICQVCVSGCVGGEGEGGGGGCTLHPTPYTLPPTSYILHPTPSVGENQRAGMPITRPTNCTTHEHAQGTWRNWSCDILVLLMPRLARAGSEPRQRPML